MVFKAEINSCWWSTTTFFLQPVKINNNAKKATDKKSFVFIEIKFNVYTRTIENNKINFKNKFTSFLRQFKVKIIQ